jgi:hypothetical protein
MRNRGKRGLKVTCSLPAHGDAENLGKDGSCVLPQRDTPQATDYKYPLAPFFMAVMIRRMINLHRASIAADVGRLLH